MQWQPHAARAGFIFPVAYKVLTAALQENEVLQAELDAMRRAPSALEAARSKKAEHASDRQKFVQLNENLQV